MKFIYRPVFVGALALALLCGTAYAEPHATAADARAMLQSAVAEIKSVGPKAAFAEFNQPNGKFHNGELYVFVFDEKGVYEAYGANPALVGADVSDLTDAQGKPIVRDMIEIAKASGKGNISNIWLNRADNHIERKVSLIELVDGHIVGVGYYPK
ncbi:cache domain-containing protein [Sphingobium sp. DEHP117]|uniref:cache domain-containing protein n=1 Tax=Sphingobium sp. DEHP117 TaxID=2993436 RepID=UPI0027D707A5|nr:cache domain-containing protein [Sphingobium sp. DEHP117]MDQ4421191.1 cache domain-containing protein [Sphingobium sp. DEHP117]